MKEMNSQLFFKLVTANVKDFNCYNYRSVLDIIATNSCHTTAISKIEEVSCIIICMMLSKPVITEKLNINLKQEENMY